MSTVADKLAKKSSSKTSSKQVRLRLVYVDFWSAVKLSFLAAVALAIVTIVAVFLIYTVLSTTGVIGKLDELLKAFDDNFTLGDYVGLPQVMAFASIVAILNLIVITVLGAVVAGIYNLMVKVTGGLLVGFTSN
ncbi:DUF3566 domain-containing protein [Microbacterium memoriense]|uniref:DUF3566 domain-containing protein n=1 Tax=Microbacterium memoriense TaxID=2978350 RepID=A0ABT2PF51_9MICO|nr:DUF3566 domain-containing protein [Microbacterium memoriense]MCT9003101.1 DUF3566 domain-containing protein [Microbacterium memoriense]